VARALGLNKVESNISLSSDTKPPTVKLRTRAPYLAYTRVDEQLAGAVQELIPGPFSARVEAVDVSDGPIVRLDLSIGLNLKNMTDLVRFAFRITPEHATVDGMASFYLRAVCQNRNLWGVEDFEEIIIRHSKYASSRGALLGGAELSFASCLEALGPNSSGQTFWSGRYTKA
jgi:hypothetical protein